MSSATSFSNVDRRDLLTCYALLRLPSDAPPEAIKSQYRRLARIWHPDRFAERPDVLTSAEERMKALNAAYLRIRGAPLRGQATSARASKTRLYAAPPASTTAYRVVEDDGDRWGPALSWLFVDDDEDVPSGAWQRPCPNCGTTVSVEGRRYAHCPRCGVGFFPHKEGYVGTSSDELSWWQSVLVLVVFVAVSIFSDHEMVDAVRAAPIPVMVGVATIVGVVLLPAWLRSKLR